MEKASDLILLTNRYPYAGGDSPFVESEIESLSKRFQRVLVWTSAWSSDEPVLKMPSNVEFMGSLTARSPMLTVLHALRPSLVARFIHLVWKELRERRSDILLPRLIRAAAFAVVGGSRLRQYVGSVRLSGSESAMYSFWGSDCAFALMDMEHAGGFCAVRFHGYDLYEERVTYLPFRRQLLERADVALSVSEHGAQYLEQKYYGRVELPPIVVARLGTPDWGGCVGVPDDILRVVSCSSLIGIKRVDYILRVLDHVARDRQVEWVHFGDGPLRAELEELAAHVSPSLTVCFKGEVQHSMLVAFYQSVSVAAFVNLSTTEGLPVSIMEALSFAIPVLATDVGGTSEIVGEELGSGILVSVEASCEEVARALTRLLSLRDQMDPRAIWDKSCNASKNGDVVARVLSESGRQWQRD